MTNLCSTPDEFQFDDDGGCSDDCIGWEMMKNEVVVGVWTGFHGVELRGVDLFGEGRGGG